MAIQFFSTVTNQVCVCVCVCVYPNKFCMVLFIIYGRNHEITAFVFNCNASWAIVSLCIQCNQAREQTFQNHYLGLKIALICLLVTIMVTTTIFIAIYRTSFFPYVANRETIHVWGTFHAFFTFFG